MGRRYCYGMTLRERIEDFLRRPLTSTFITLLVLVTGGVASLASVEIRNAFPFYWGWSLSFSGWAIAFWSMAFMSAILFFLRQVAVDTAREQAQSELRDTATSMLGLQKHASSQMELLDALVRTMPPENFLEHFVQYYAASEKSIETAYRTAGPGQVEASRLAILTVLRVIASLAKQFDGNRPDRRYAANVMLFTSAQDLSEQQIASFAEDVLFCDETVDPRKLRGVLELVPHYSCSDDESLVPDDRLRRIVLPIPATPKNPKGKWLVLPGAPMAFVTGMVSSFIDTKSSMKEWLDNEGDFQELIKDRLVTYFAEHQHVRSFVSIPLLPSERLYAKSGEAEAIAPLGVLNIHTDHAGLLRHDSTAATRGSPLSNFNAIIQPFVLNLIKLLSLHAKSQGGNAELLVTREQSDGGLLPNRVD